MTHGSDARRGRRVKNVGLGLRLVRGTLLVAAAAGLLSGPVDGAESSARLDEGRAHLAAGRFEEAKKAFEKANREAGGKCAPCFVGVGAAKLQLEDLKGARKAGEKAAKLAGADLALKTEAHLIVGFARFRQAKGREGDLRKAEKAFRAALEASPGNLQAVFNLGVVLLGLSRDEEGVAELRKYVETAPSGPFNDRARSYIANPRRAREPFAPDFSVRTLKGEVLTLESFRGRTLVVDFWGTWCPPCVASVPEIKDLRRRYPEDQLAVLSVSVGDEEDAWQSFVASHEMTWLQYRDADRKLVEAFRVRAFPTYFVIDGEGAVVSKLQGIDNQRSLAYRLRSRLDELLSSE